MRLQKRERALEKPSGRAIADGNLHPYKERKVSRKARNLQNLLAHRAARNEVPFLTERISSIIFKL